MYLWVNRKQQRRASLRANAIGQLVQKSEGDEQALYVLLGATRMRISEALAVQIKHFVNDGRTIQVREKVRIVTYLKTDAAYRDIDLHPDVAEYLERSSAAKMACCLRPGMARRTCTTTSRTAGSQNGSKR